MNVLSKLSRKGLKENDWKCRKRVNSARHPSPGSRDLLSSRISCSCAIKKNISWKLHHKSDDAKLDIQHHNSHAEAVRFLRLSMQRQSAMMHLDGSSIRISSIAGFSSMAQKIFANNAHARAIATRREKLCNSIYGDGERAKPVEKCRSRLAC